MTVTAFKTSEISAVADDAAHRLLSVHRWSDACFINLPLVFPGGGSVTVKLDQVRGGVRVSDGGFAFREIECIGCERSFPRTARGFAESRDLQVDRRTVFVDVPEDQVASAICDVAITSWQIVDRVFSWADEREEEEIADYLRERLVTVFGPQGVSDERTIKGHSSSDWEVAAIVQMPDHLAAFAAVSPHANSIFRTSTAFHDIACLDNPPRLVSVVQSINDLGPKLDLLSQAGRVIEGTQPDEAYVKAAA